jgi:hypothetical protein
VSMGSGISLQRFVYEFRVCEWEPLSGPQVSGLASELWKTFEEHVLGSMVTSLCFKCHFSLLFLLLPLQLHILFNCSDGNWVWDSWSML